MQRSFELCHVPMTEPEYERVFQRIYSKFGSHAACEIYLITCLLYVYVCTTFVN